MSEVKRYHVTDAGLVEGQALGRINVVLGPDYDSAVQCFLTAAEGCVAAERRERALQTLLTAADERADTATSLIQRIVANFDTEIEFHEDVEPNDLEHDQVLAEMRVFLATLKPAEGGGDELDDHDRSAQAYWADQAAQGKPYEQQLREACERNGIDHGLDEE